MKQVEAKVIARETKRKKDNSGDLYFLTLQTVEPTYGPVIVKQFARDFAEYELCPPQTDVTAQLTLNVGTDTYGGLETTAKFENILPVSNDSDSARNKSGSAKAVA